MTHTLLTHTPYQHILSTHTLNIPIPDQHTLPTHPPNIPSQHTPSQRTPYHHTLPHHTLSTHPTNTPYQHIGNNGDALENLLQAQRICEREGLLNELRRVIMP